MKKYLLCLSWLLASCTAHRSATGSGSSSFLQETARPDHVIFLTLNISRDTAAGQSQIRVLNTVSKEGTLKRGDLEPETHAGARLKCELLAGESVTDSFLVEHPLFKDVEYLNDQHAYARKEVRLNSQDFFIRFRQGQAQSIRISEMLPGIAMQELLTIKLP